MVVEVGSELLKHIVQQGVILMVEHVDVVLNDLGVWNFTIGQLNGQPSVLEDCLHLKHHYHFKLQGEFILHRRVATVKFKDCFHVIVFSKDNTWVFSELHYFFRAIDWLQSECSV